VRDTRTRCATKMAVRKDGSPLESVISRARALRRRDASCPSDAADSLVFREAGSRDVLTSLARFAGISLVFDPQFRSVPLSIDLRGSSLPAAWTPSARHRHVLARHGAVQRDGGAERASAASTKRKSSARSTEQRGPQGNARSAAHRRGCAPAVADQRDQTHLHQGHTERIEAAGACWPPRQARAEVVIDVELLEVDRTRFKHTHPDRVAATTSGSRDSDINQVGASRSNSSQLARATCSSRTFGPVLSPPQAGQRHRVLATRNCGPPTDCRPAKFGERSGAQVTFAPIATGGVNQQPITSFTYRNVGQHRHHAAHPSQRRRESRVKIEVSSVAGTGYSAATFTHGPSRRPSGYATARQPARGPIPTASARS